MAQMQLLGALREVARAIHVMASDILSHKTAHAHELEQGLLDRALELTGQLRGQTPPIRARDKLLCRVNERAKARKVNTPAGPQSSVVELGQGLQRVKLAAVRIARAIRKLLQFAKHRSLNSSAQGILHLFHCHNLSAPKQRKQCVSVEPGYAHNVRSRPN